MRSCARCPNPVRAEGQRYCARCHAEYQRGWRAQRNALVVAARRILARMGTSGRTVPEAN